MSPPPTISVVIPVFNALPYLEQALQSVVDQTYGDFELILIDDGSTDGSTELLKQYAGRDRRIRLKIRSNRGVVDTRNEGLELAAGQYIAIMDADDVCLPQRFEKQLGYLREHPQCVAVGCRVLLIDPEGEPIREMAVKQGHEEIEAAHLAGRGATMVHPAVMMSREAVQRVGGYRKQCNLSEDLDLFLRLGEVGRLYNLPEVLLHYRQHTASAGYAQREIQARSAQEALDDAYRRRGLGTAPSLHSHQMPVASYVDHHRKWSWWALQAGNLNTARKHARKVLRQAPLDLESWRLWWCVRRGY